MRKLKKHETFISLGRKLFKIQRFVFSASRKSLIVLLIASWIFSGWYPLAQYILFELPFEPKKAEAAYANGYEYRRSIIINESMVTGSGDHTDFPLLASFTETTFRTTVNGGSVTNSDGYDIIFTSDAAGTTQLDHEIERYNGTTGEVNMWVRVPTLDFDNNTTIYMFYGNSSISSSQEDISGTWDSGYVAVHHLHQTSGQHLDSTSNNNDSTSVSVTTQGSAAGKIAGADSFNGTSNSVTIPDSATLDITNTGTIEAWVEVTSTSTAQSNFSTWTAQTAPTGISGDEYSQLDSVVVGETIHYGAVTVSGTGDTFLTATSSLDMKTFSAWTTRSSPDGATAAGEGSSIAVDSNGDYIFYTVLNNDGTTGNFSWATSTLDHSSFSAWRAQTDPTGVGGDESSGIDAVVTGDRLRFAAVMVTGATEDYEISNVGINGSSFSGWNEGLSNPAGAAATEGCGTATDTDGTRQFYATVCNNGTAYDYERSNQALGASTISTWSNETDPTGAGADDHGFNDIALVGDHLYQAMYGFSAGTELFATADSHTTLSTPAMSWTSRQSGGLPDGGGDTNSADAAVESDGKTLFYSAFAHNGTTPTWYTASSTLAAQPFVAKRNAYEVMQVADGFMFDWVGKPQTFATTTNPSRFYHAAITHTGSFINYYFNGYLVASTSVTTNFETNTNDLLLGSGFRTSSGEQLYLGGIVDEVRVSNTARSTDWIRTQFHNQNATSTFYTLGAQEQSISPTISSASNQTFVIGQASTQASIVRITDNTGAAEVTLSNDIRITIATTSGFGMEWDTSVTTPSFDGSGSGKVSGTVSYPSPSELLIDVTTTFDAGDTLTVSGLKYQNFTAPPKSGTGALFLHLDGSATPGSPTATSSELVTISQGRRAKVNVPQNYLTLISGLYAHWSMDGKNMYQHVSDSVGNLDSFGFPHHLYLMDGATGETSTTTALGKIGQALRFNGSTEYAQPASTSVLRLGGPPDNAFSIALWFKRNGAGVAASTGSGGVTDEPIIAKGTGQAETPANLNMNYHLGVSVAAGNRLTADFEDTNNGLNHPLTSTTTVINNQWYHAVLTYITDSTRPNFKIYVNGEYDSASTTSLVPEYTSIQPFSLATGLTSAYARTGFFNGDIDEVRIYSRELNAEEINALFKLGQAKLSTTPAAAPQSGFLAHWTFDGKNMFRNVQDISGASWHGNLVVGAGGNTSTTTAFGRVGQALEFDGTDDYVSVGNIGSGIRTISFWMKGDSVISKKIINIDGTDQIETNGSGAITATSFPAATVYVNGAVGSTVAPGNWYHVVVTDTSGVSGTTFEIGRVGGSYFDGVLDDVRVYNYVMSLDEVRTLYRSSTANVKN